MVTKRKVVHQSFTNFNWPCQFGLNWKNIFLYMFSMPGLSVCSTLCGLNLLLCHNFLL